MNRPFLCQADELEKLRRRMGQPSTSAAQGALRFARAASPAISADTGAYALIMSACALPL